jgi:hypothetical protein
MNAARFLYRTRQFWQALRSPPSAVDSELIQSILTAPQLALFQGMQASERTHSLRVLQALLEQGETQGDLLVAALLHDVGKSRAPLRLWERIAIVLVKAVCPYCVKRWGEGSAGDWRRNWRRTFVISARHPDWGAEMAAEAGASILTQALIRRHQEGLPPPGDGPASLEDRLLARLVEVDDES